MKLEPWEPDVRSLLARIVEGELDLQPDFQRGTAWSLSKQQRLIDSILRGWALPPVHVLVRPDERLAVLDGQQRLSAIRDFHGNKFAIGSFKPFDSTIESLRGSRFQDLDEVLQRRFLNFKVPAYRLYEYSPEEPYELFFRLNLPTGLTQAEKRNALFGKSREQVRDLTDFAKQKGWGTEQLGFANARLAYEDIIARVCTYVDRGSLRTALTPAAMEDLYRSQEGFSDTAVSEVAGAVAHFGEATGQLYSDVRFNKATVLSWLVFLVRLHRSPATSAFNVPSFIGVVERGRIRGRESSSISFELGGPSHVVQVYLDTYSDRASSRVTDVLSVVARDAILWRLASSFDMSAADQPIVADLLQRLDVEEQRSDFSEFDLLVALEPRDSWGDL